MPAKKKVAKKMTTKQMKKTKGGADVAWAVSAALRAHRRANLATERLKPTPRSTRSPAFSWEPAID